MLRAFLQRLQRRTTSGHWIPEIDGLRFVAIAAVILFHMRGELMRAGSRPVPPRYAGLFHTLDFGHRGVQLFFVISGFILAQPFAAHYLQGARKPPLRRYFLRRVTRLEPPYIFNLIVSAVLLQLAWHLGIREVAMHLAAAVVYLDSWFLHWHGRGLLISGVAWSLEIEIQFYLLAPLLAWLFYRRQNPLLRRGLLLAFMLGAAALQSTVNLGPNSLLWQIQYFLAGLLLADLNLQVLAHTPRSLWWDVASAAGWPLVFCLGADENFWLAPLCIVLYAGALHGRLFRHLFRVPLLAVIGGMCYTIYLWHPIAMSLAQRLLSRVDTHLPAGFGPYFLVQAVVKTTAIAAVSLPMYLLVERPCMDPQWSSKLLAYVRGEQTAISRRTQPAGDQSREDLAT